MASLSSRVKPPSGSRAKGRADAKPLVLKYMDKSGVIDVGRLVSGFLVSRDQLAQSAGLAASTLGKRDRSMAARPQARLREMLEILSRIEDWSGGEVQALAWYRSQPIPALDGRTAEALVRDGKASSVRSYLDHVALGGFA